MLDLQESVHRTTVTVVNPRKLVLGRRPLIILSSFCDNIFWIGFRLLVSVGLEGETAPCFFSLTGVKLESDMQLKDIVFFLGGNPIVLQCSMHVQVHLQPLPTSHHLSWTLCLCLRGGRHTLQVDSLRNAFEKHVRQVG